MIESLTPEQQARLPEIRDEWLKIGLSCEPANWEEAEAAIADAYRAKGLTVPDMIYRELSPMAGIARLKKLNPDLSWSSCVFYGSHDADFLAWSSAFREFGVTGIEHIDPLVRVARNAGWWFPLDEAVIITDRPAYLKRDTQLRLHAEDGPAMEYRDGWKIYSWHGSWIPETLINPGWSVEEIAAERNTEIRRCAIERMGWDKFITDANMAKVSEAPDPGNPGCSLELYDLPEKFKGLYDNPARMLLCTNGTAERDGTRRRFALPVPASFSDPVDAAASLYNWSRDEYLQVARRA